jgi:hypothetical protein
MPDKRRIFVLIDWIAISLRNKSQNPLVSCMSHQRAPIGLMADSIRIFCRVGLAPKEQSQL